MSGERDKAKSVFSGASVYMIAGFVIGLLLPDDSWYEWLAHGFTNALAFGCFAFVMERICEQTGMS